MLQMLKNACECLCKFYEYVANETRMQICIIHIAGVSCCLISARTKVYIASRYMSGPVQLAYFPSNLGLIFHIRTAFCGNTNVGESLQTSYHHLQVQTTNVLTSIRMAYDCSLICCEYICFSYEF